MALPKTGSGSFKPPRSYERNTRDSRNMFQRIAAGQYFTDYGGAPQSPMQAPPLGMGDRQMKDRFLPQNPMLGMGDRQMLDRPAPPAGPLRSPFAGSQQSQVDLSGLNARGRSTGSTLPGMFMQGPSGLAAGGMLTGSRMGSAFAGLESARQAQLSPDFMGPKMQNPMQAGPWDQRASEQTRRQNIMAQSPMLGSSSQAGMLGGRLTDQGLQNPMSAGVTNGYNGQLAAMNDPNRLTPDQKYALAQQSAQGMNKFDPTNVSGRFGPNSGLGRQAAAISQGMAGVNAGTHYEIPQGYGQMPEYRPIGQSPEVQYIKNEQGNMVSNIAGGPLPFSGINALRGQTANPSRGESRRVRKALEQERRDTVKFKHMVSKGMNPMSPQARAMFPNQVAQMNGQSIAGQNPMGIAGTSFAPGNPRTPGSLQEAGVVMDGLAKGDPTNGIPPDPFLASVGASGSEDTTVDNVHKGLVGMADRGVSPTVSDLRSLRGYLSALRHRSEAGVGALSPSAMNQGGNGAPDYAGLEALPDNASDEDLMAWWRAAQGKLNPFSPNPGRSPLNSLNPAIPGGGGGIWSGVPVGR